MVVGVVFEPWDFVRDNRDELLDGLLNTVEVSAIAIAGALLIGAVLGAARAHRIPVISQLAAVYVEVIRNTPILVQIFMLFFALPSSINTYIAVLKNTALLYVISYQELTKTAYDINAATLQTLETFFVLGVVYLTLVWTLSGLIRLLEARLALPEGT